MIRSQKVIREGEGPTYLPLSLAVTSTKSTKMSFFLIAMICNAHFRILSLQRMIYKVKCRPQMHLNYKVKCRDPIRLNDLEREMPLPKTFVAVSPTFKNEHTRLSWNAHISGFGSNTCES